MTYEVWLEGAGQAHKIENVERVEQTENTYSFYDEEDVLLFSAPFSSIGSVEKI